MTLYPAVACHPAIALPDNVLTKDDVLAGARALLGEGFPHLDRLLRIIEGAGVERRHLVRPLGSTLEVSGFGARNDLYIQEAKRLGERAAAGALTNAGLAPADIDLVITTSCTGVMIPSLDAYLLPRMGFRPGTKRLPITEIGCAAGAAALARAREFCQVYPGANVLIVAVELCSLTYQPGDVAMQALVGAILFGDGAAATVVRGAAAPGLALVANDSWLFPDSWDYMGFDVRDTGMHLVLDKGIPHAVEKQIAPVFRGFLEKHHVAPGDVDFFCLHPGGRKVIDEIERVFALHKGETQASRDCLAEVGNLSSASVLVVLKHVFERYRPAAGDTGLLAAFGPGFSAEMVLGTWSEG